VVVANGIPGTVAMAKPPSWAGAVVVSVVWSRSDMRVGILP